MSGAAQPVATSVAKPILAALATALALNAANAPFDQGWLALAAAAPLFLLFEESAKRRFFAGWLAGFATQAIGYYWVFYTIRDFSGQSAAVSLAGGLLFWLYQGLDLALWLLLAPLLFRPLPKWARAFGAAGLWLFLQTALFPYVFQWTYGAALASVPILAKAAAWWDVQGLGFLAFWLQGLAVFYRDTPKKAVLAAFAALALMAAGGLAHRPGPADAWRIGVIQPNLIPFAKQGRATMDELFRAHAEPSRQFIGRDLDLLIWPETALAFNLAYYEYFQAQTRSLARELGAAIVTGALGVDEDGAYYNEIWLIGPGDDPPQIYRKEKLVLFSEKLPWIFSWAAQFDSAIGGFRSGSGNRPFEYRGKRIVPLVCFEALFSTYVRDRRGHLLLNLTNDAWFGRSKASAQHLQQIRLRAVERQAPMVRAANSGITCWVDVNGRVRQAGGIYEEDVFVFETPVPEEEPPGYNGHGLALLSWLSLATMLVSLRLRFRKDRAPRRPP